MRPHSATFVSGHHLALVAFATATACAQTPSRPADPPYVAPAPGTVYRYEGLENTITDTAGLRTWYVDGAGREGLRLGLFIPAHPTEPVAVDSAALAGLWPLRVGHQAVVSVQRGEEVYEWEFLIRGRETVSVPAGTFATYVVQATEKPRLVHSPQSAYSAIYTWNYAPEVSAVVRFRTRYIAGPALGRTIEADLLGIDSTNVTATTG